MKKTTLINKLKKSNIAFQVTLAGNEFNEIIKFSIDGKSFEASVSNDKLKIDSYSRAYGYDDANQAETCFFFETLPQVLRHARR